MHKTFYFHVLKKTVNPLLSGVAWVQRYFRTKVEKIQNEVTLEDYNFWNKETFDIIFFLDWKDQNFSKWLMVTADELYILNNGHDVLKEILLSSIVRQQRDISNYFFNKYENYFVILAWNYYICNSIKVFVFQAVLLGSSDILHGQYQTSVIRALVLKKLK